MAQTLSTYLTIVQSEVDDTSVKGAIIITQLLKETYQEIIQRVYPYLVGYSTQDIAATADLATYTPNDFQDINKVLFKTSTDTNYHTLTPITWDDYLTYYINSTSGTPEYFFKNANVIQIVPAPSESGTLRVIYTPVTAELTSSSIIPDRFSNVVKNGASYKYFAQDDNPKASEYKLFFEEGLRNMINELSQTTEQVRPKFFGR